MSKTVVIIGGGNLGGSLSKGLVLSKQCNKDNLIISEKYEVRAAQLRKEGFNVTSDNKEAVSVGDVVIMSVKPQQFAGLAEEIKGCFKKDALILSTITGVSFAELEDAIGKFPIARVVPNTALDILESMTCLTFNSLFNDVQKNFVVDLFDHLGRTMVIEEELMAAATVVGACGTAFALRFMRAMAQGGIEIGFGSKASHFITAQTVKGAARLILESGNHPEFEIDKVTTPQGITISGLNEMTYHGLSSSVIKGLVTSYNKLEMMQEKK